MFGIGSIVSAITGLFGNNLIGKIFGNKEEREKAVHEEQTDVLEEFASENVVRDNRTWFDSLIDGLNRIPRPLGFFLAIFLLVWPIIAPVSFAVAMQAYVLIPPWLIQMIMGIFALYYGGRIISKDLNLVGPTAGAVRTMLANQEAVKNAFQEHKGAVNTAIAAVIPTNSMGERLDNIDKLSDRKYKTEMRNTAKPLSLSSIERWNELNAKK